MTTAEIKALMEEIEENGCYEIVGIRTQEQPFELGEMIHNSKVWVDGEETGEELEGVCASTIHGARMHADDHANNFYFGDHVAIIVGSDYESGEDEYEVIIKDPRVIKILK